MRAADPKTNVQILIMQRLHDSDLAGYLQDQKGGMPWTVLRLPMYFEAEYPCVTFLDNGERFGGDWRTVEGEPLCPARWDEAWLLDKRAALGDDWSAQYQQRPSSVAGQIFQRSWFKFWTIDGLRELGANPVTGVGFEDLACSWDFAFKETRGSDFVCGQVWGKLGPNFYLLERVYQKMNFPTSLTAIKAQRRRWPGICATLIEDKANGPAIISSLEAQVPGIIPINPTGGKPARASAVSPLHRAGNVWYPPDYEFDKSNTSHVENMAGFPFAKHDDSVDAETQMLAYWIANQNQLFAAYAAQRRQKEAQAAAQANARR
jgi:predicted phage terminase large subunit-like protein